MTNNIYCLRIKVKKNSPRKIIHDMIDNHRCKINSAKIGERADISVYFDDGDMPTHVSTSRVIGIYKRNEKEIVIETANSIYSFKALKEDN